MYAAPTEEAVRLVAGKDTQCSPGTLQGRKALLILAAEVPEEQNNRQSDIHSDLAYCEKQCCGVHITS